MRSRGGALPEKPVEPPLATLLWRRRQVIGWTVLAAFILASVYLVLARRTYKSTASVYILEGRGQVMGQEQADESRSDDYLNTQCELFTSTPVLALALSEDGVANLDTLKNESDPVQYLQQNIDAEVGKHDDLIYVSLETRNKADAAKLVNAVVQAYVTYQTKIQHSTSAEVLDLLEKKQAHDEDAIAVKNQELAALRDLYGETAYDSTMNNPVIQQESALSTALTQARLEAVDAKSEYNQALAMVGNNNQMMQKIEAPDSPADAVAASPEELPGIKTQIIQYEQFVQDMERTYLPDHPRVQTAVSRLNELIVMYVRAERQRWLSAQAHTQALQESFDQQHKIVLEQANRATDYDRVSNELKRIQTDLDVIGNRINEVSANQDAGSLNIQITQPALPANGPSHPAKLHVLAGWLLMGLLVGCGLAIALEKMPLGPRPMSELSVELGAPVIGVLPPMPMATMAERSLQAHFDPSGAVAETSRSIARVVAESGLDEAGGRTLLIASMNPLEGRTTLATNLAIAMAQSGMRVLLIDANNRAPRLHALFNLNNQFGLFDILSGQTAQQRATHHTQIENVDVLTAGTMTSNTVDLLNTELLVDVLGEFSDQYDRVIVDSPALGRGVEARILAANCAAAILVTAARPTARRQIGFGLGLLRSVGANVLGLVINEPSSFDPRKPARVGSNVLRDPLATDKARSFHNALASGSEE